MSRTLTHGKTDAQISGDHARRLQAVERNLSLEQARYGIPGLRDRLYLAANQSRGEQCRNFEPGFGGGNYSLASSGANRYMAVYWPGGTCTGMTFILNTVGSYSDLTPNSGGAFYSYDGTTLTRIAQQTAKWATGNYPSSGLNRLQWALPVYAVEGVYYVAIRYYLSSSPASIAPVFSSAPAQDPTTWGGDVNEDGTPSSWPLLFSQTDTTNGPLASSVTAASLTVGSAIQLPYVGLF